jgi:aspartyl protease family protein
MTDPNGPWRPNPRPPARRRGLLLWLGLLGATVLAVIFMTRLFPGSLSRGDWTEAFRLFGLLALVSSGLVAARRIDLGVVARNVAMWVAIFALVVLGYAFRGELLTAGLRLRSALVPAYGVTDSPHSMVVGRGEGNAFYVMGEVNGTPVRFVVDTGASDIVLSPQDAARAGLRAPSTKYSRPSETANGVGYGAPMDVQSLVVGPIRLANVHVFVNQAPMNASLLGMTFLDRLDSFEVRGDQLFLRGRG